MSTPRSEWPRNPYRKQYVPVRVDFLEDGYMVPYALLWTDGREYSIDRVTDVRNAPALKAGGMGVRYTVEVCGQERFLFFEHNANYRSERPGRWFLEVKKNDGE